MGEDAANKHRKVRIALKADGIHHQRYNTSTSTEVTEILQDKKEP